VALFPVDRPWELVVSDAYSERLMQHLFSGDGDEHAAVILAGLHVRPDRVRLLVRDVVLAEEGVDHVRGQRGYKMITAQFMKPHLRRAREEKLVFLSVHNHGGTDRVAFSPDDLASHERGYPALLDIVNGQPVGALVYAQAAVAGSIWLPGGACVRLGWSTILGASRTIWRPEPVVLRKTPDAHLDRQVRLFGSAGQAILQDAKVAIVGLGGAGSQLAELLGRLGVGHFVLVDPDRADLSNLPRLVAARRSDVLMSEARARRLPFSGWFDRLRRRKVDLAARNIRRANRKAKIERIAGSVVDHAVAHRLLDADFIFLAADEMGARLVVNAIVQQYLIPAVQVGARVVTDPRDGSIEDVFAVSRPMFPQSGCLWCNGLIDPTRLAEELTDVRQAQAQAYGSESPAPSVASLNALATSDAVNLFQFHMTGLARPGAHKAFRRYRPLKGDVRLDEPRRDSECTECGLEPGARYARGSALPLPTR
jgi:tRNA A37 threonylcarbamoyladenosine dehydratase